MKPLSPDTTPAAQRKHYELMGKLPPMLKLKMALELTDTTRKLVLSDLKHRFPTANDQTIRRKFIARVLSREEAMHAYGFDPNTEDE